MANPENRNNLQKPNKIQNVCKRRFPHSWLAVQPYTSSDIPSLQSYATVIWESLNSLEWCPNEYLLLNPVNMAHRKARASDCRFREQGFCLCLCHQ